MSAATVAFLLLLAFGAAVGVGSMLLLGAFVVVVNVLARVARAVRRAWFATAAWRARDWSPLTHARVRWMSRRLDRQLSCLLAAQGVSRREHPDGSRG
jgi:hypothetical protein